jgi:uncharacterized Zn-binding protein involved in type VI secretion
VQRWSNSAANYKRLISDPSFDVSSPRDGAVFYSNEWDDIQKVSVNRLRAEAYVHSRVSDGQRSTTLETTPAGLWLDNQKLLDADCTFSKSDKIEIWNQCSRKYADGASGSARCFVTGASPGGVFRTVEMKALIDNPAVTDVNGIPRAALTQAYRVGPNAAFDLIQKADLQLRASSESPAEAAANIAGAAAGGSASASTAVAASASAKIGGGGMGGGPPAARLTDNHVCPMFNGPVPHVGGPIIQPGCPTVLIGGMPAARVTDMLVCAGPMDVIAKGSATVFIGGVPAARIGDTTAHGGVIVTGFPTVLIGG